MTEAADSEPEIENPHGFTGAMLHMGVAEQGKLYALEDDHKTALLYYRRAMHMTVSAGDEEWFFRHYLECVLESLELTGSYAEVLDYCDKAIALYGDAIPEDDISLRDLAHIHQRRGIVLLKEGDREAATEALATAYNIARVKRQRLPLAERVLRWLQSGLTLDLKRILAEQKKEMYFTVRHDSVEPKRAVRLPRAMLDVAPF